MNELKYRTHRIKCDQPFFQNVKSGRKKFEIRKDDRDYQVGDTLILYYDQDEIYMVITYKTTYEQKEGYCVLGIEPEDNL